MRCNRDDCGQGDVDDEGFCSVCDREPLPRDGADGGSSPSSAQGPRALPQGAVGVAPVRPDPWYGLGLVPDRPLPSLPAARSPGPVAEEHRYCPNPACQLPVGRARDGEPGLTRGYCGRCGTAFDFTDVWGRVVGDRYELRLLLGSGAYGAAYLAWDRNLKAPVVIKELAASVAETAEEEREALVSLRHDAIVRILDYAKEGRYLALEYVPGAPFTAHRDDRLETLLAHGIRILQALEYLHDRELLHCDVKPLNIIRFADERGGTALDRVRVIDFGAVRRLRDRRPLQAYTEFYAPPPNDPERSEPSPGFDLFTVGRTLQEVCAAHVRDLSAPGVRALVLLLERATDREVPGRRFVSARQFAEQLSGVVRQVVAVSPTGRQVTRPSALFGPMREPLHGGLGSLRPLSDWTDARTDTAGSPVLAAPFSCPRPPEIASALPTPVTDPDDPGLPAATQGALAACRQAVRDGDAEGARHALAGTGLPQWHWLHAWYSGLVALLGSRVPAAAGHFNVVRAALPGELLPLLALGLCAELPDAVRESTASAPPGDAAAALMYYRTVFETAPALAAAGFGMARVHLHTGRRNAAAEVVDRLAQEFRYQREARIAAVRLRTAVIGPPHGAVPTQGDLAAEGDLAAARAALAGLDVDDAGRAGLEAEIQYAAFLRGQDRLELSETVRALAPHAPGEREYVALVDLVNRLRPPLSWSWRGRSGRSRQSRSDSSRRQLSSS
ncbi:tetratricopeptide repeat protein [Streptomyces sp. V3I7]|uniref:tetratricopeptide repeat protein n=1 Tax=Streptomyces sp. V3I7 TaxID=3042278 RepID=UPI00278AD224|nr:tetratricopeptide repeat protein [Streptomyces sp. V3I7]MDQ0994705.1 serine/threonine-protein kinase PknG [Streptomyces sp. V3I7]